MKIIELQQRLTDALNGVEKLVQGGCKALAEDTLEIVHAVESQLAQAFGVAIVVTTPEFRRNGCAAAAIPVESSLAIRCIEVVATNREQPGHLTALDAAEIVAHSLTDENIQFESIYQTSDERAGTVMATVNFNVSIHLT